MNRRPLFDRRDAGEPLSTGDLARATGYSPRHVLALIEAGKITAGRAYPGAHYRIPAAEAARFIEAVTPRK